MKKNFPKIAMVIAVVVLVALSGLVGECIGSRDKLPVDTSPTVSPAEVAGEIIRKEDEKKAAAVELVSAMAPAHENVVAQPSPEAIKPPEPKLSDTIIYIGESISLGQANFLKEITLQTQQGEQWRVWMQSKVSFSMRSYAFDTNVDAPISLSVYLQPEDKWDDDNYIILDFVLFPPLGDTIEWGATIRRFESKTQGRAQFSPAYDMHARNFKKAEILHLARQVLDIALAPSS